MTFSPPPMPLLSISSPETIEKCSLLDPRASDIFICSYPKSGTTWTQHIVLSLVLCHLTNTATTLTSSSLPPEYSHVSEYAPFYEIDAHWEGNCNNMIPSIRENHSKLGRRVFNTHLRLGMLPKPASKSNAPKLIYVIRSPLEVCVSFYHHLSNQVEGGYEGSFDEFFRDWIDGKIAFGSWVHHVLTFAQGMAEGTATNGYIQLKDGRHILLVSYKDMVTDLVSVVKQLVDFLELNVSLQDLKELVPTFSFQSMKNDLDRFQPQSVTWKNNFSFLRRGVSGDSIELVTRKQEEIFGEWIQSERYNELLTSWLKEKHPLLLDQFLMLLKPTREH